MCQLYNRQKKIVLTDFIFWWDCILIMMVYDYIFRTYLYTGHQVINNAGFGYVPTTHNRDYSGTKGRIMYKWIAAESEF